MQRLANAVELARPKILANDRRDGAGQGEDRAESDRNDAPDHCPTGHRTIAEL